MRLTPLDIKKQEFSRGMRGYDMDEVQAFLSMMANQWEEMQAEHRRSEEKIRDLKAKMEHYERVEVALQEALQTARENAKQALDNAKQEAKLIVKKAVSEAEDLSRNAVQQRDALANEIEGLLHRRSEMVARLRAFLNSEGEILARFEQQEKLATPAPVVRAAAPPEKPAETAPPKTESPKSAQLKTEAPKTEARKAEATKPTIVEPAPEARAQPPQTPPLPPEPEVETEAIDLDELENVLDDTRSEKESQSAESVVAERPAPEPETVPTPDAVTITEAPVEQTFMPVDEAQEHPALQISIPDEDEDPFYREKEPLSFKFFEPNAEKSARSFYEDGKEQSEQFGPDALPVQKSDREPVSNETWIVRPDNNTPESASIEGGLTASAEEIEKIRKILNDLD